MATAEVDGTIYAIGGSPDLGVVATVYAYDPAGGLWSTRTDMPTPRSMAAAAVVDGKIYVIGGGLEWFSGVAEIPGRIETLRSAAVDTRTKVADLSWERMFDTYLTPHLKILAALPGIRQKDSSS